MKTILSIPRVAFLALALGTATATATFAQSTTTTSTTPPTCSAGGKYHHHGLASVLSADEIAQLKAAHEKALAGDSSLQTAQANLKSQFQALKAEGKDTATKTQWQALKAQAHAFHQQMRAAELKIDPTLAPVFSKLEAAHKNWHHSD